MSDTSAVRLRFAPSPTGYLHVGGARTALFNWLHARKTGGAFILRIEDTDRERSTAAAYQAILRSMEWLGLTWDEGPGVGGPCGPYLQSERLEVYQQQAAALRASGRLYRCFCTGEEIATRNAARGEQESAGYDGHCRELATSQVAAFEADGRAPSWRLRTPDEGETFWYDLVYDKREFRNDLITDRVVMKQDGFPTYNFAVVVDDHLMRISHVLRGDDHVSNTPFQLQIYDALGWERPKFGHMPMILGPDRKRLSKRHGATSVEEFRDQGILPDAMINYLALLGWSPGASGDEVFTRDALVKAFSLKRVNSSPAAFDYDKLTHINAQHLKRLGPSDRLALAEPMLDARGWTLDPAWRAPADDTRAYLSLVLAMLGGRFSDLRRVPEQVGFFFTDDFPVDPEAAAHLADAEIPARLLALADRLEAALPAQGPAPQDAYEEAVRGLAADLGLEAGDLIHPCRVALTGLTRSAGMFEVMWLIGGPRTVARLRAAAGAR